MQNNSATQIIGRYTEMNDIELSGNIESLYNLAQFIIVGSYPLVYNLFVPHNLSAKPYDKFLTSLYIIQNKDFIVINRTESKLFISGSMDKLRILSENIIWITDQASKASSDLTSKHLHLEYYTDHPYLAETSLSLVVSLSK